MGWEIYQNRNALTLAYTYEDEGGELIDLTGYASAVFLAVAPDEAGASQPGTGEPVEIAAAIDADPTTGVVTAAVDGTTTQITVPGLWQFQAKCTPIAPGALPLYGLPLQLSVAANLDD